MPKLLAILSRTARRACCIFLISGSIYVISAERNAAEIVFKYFLVIPAGLGVFICARLTEADAVPVTLYIECKCVALGVVFDGIGRRAQSVAAAAVGARKHIGPQMRAALCNAAHRYFFNIKIVAVVGGLEPAVFIADFGQIYIPFWISEAL